MVVSQYFFHLGRTCESMQYPLCASRSGATIYTKTVHKRSVVLQYRGFENTLLYTFTINIYVAFENCIQLSVNQKGFKQADLVKLCSLFISIVPKWNVGHTLFSHKWESIYSFCFPLFIFYAATANHALNGILNES